MSDPFFSVTVDAREYTAWGLFMRDKGFEVVKTEIAKAQKKSGESIVRRAKANIVNQKIVDTWRLYRSIGYRIKGLRVEAGSPLEYAQVVEDGRRPGGKMPPIDVIAGWAARHNIPVEAAFPIARAIQRRGIRGRPYLRPALAFAEKDVRKFFAAANEAIVKTLFEVRRA